MRTARLVLIVALVAACGGGAPSRTLPNGSPVAVIDSDCEERIRPLYDALRDLSSRLNVGLNKNDYSTRLGDIRVVYDQAVSEGAFPTGACFDTVKKLEDAGNRFTEANTRWAACIAETNCDVATDVWPEMQGKWSEADNLLDEVAIAFP